VKIAEKCRAGESNTPKKVARERKERQREGGGGVCAREERRAEVRERISSSPSLPTRRGLRSRRGFSRAKPGFLPPLVSSSQSHLIPYYYY
jgi:hypothetical protein